MTAIVHKRTLADAIFFEPIELVISQPHQALISSASVYLVAAEAGILIEWPWNVALAVGAEWAYLRGLTSGQGVQTRWAAALNWSAVALVVLYGSLWGLRRFALVPDVPPWWGAIILTAIHILCIGAVTLCSAMCHRAALIAERTTAAAEADLGREIEHKRALMHLELERQWKEQQLAQASARAQLEIEISKKQAHAAMRSASSRMRRDARPASMDAAEQKCPNCGAEIASRSTWLAARRWGHCEACKRKA